MNIESVGAAAVQQNSALLSAQQQESAPVQAPQESAPRQDRFIPDETPKGVGLYAPERDEAGGLSITFDAPRQAAPSDSAHAEKNADSEEAAKGQKEAKAEECTVNTDRVDQEIRKLREQKEQLEKSLQATEDPQKRAALEKQLSTMEAQLLQKDNDTYRKQHAVVS